MLFMVFMVVAMVANAQEIVSMGCGEIMLQGGVVLDASRIPNAHMLRVGEDINFGIQRVNALVAQRRRMEAMKAAYTDMYTMAANAAAYGGACYGGVVAPAAVGGYESSGITIGNEHWGFSTNSSKCGAYESGSTNVRIGGFQIGTYNSGISKAAKKAAAKQAAQRYSNMKNNRVATSASTRSTASNKKVVREVNLLDAGL